MDMRDYISSFLDDALFLDGFDEAIIGHAERCGMSVVLYDAYKCIEILQQDMSEEEAIEYFEYNILGAYVGENTPMFAYLEKY